jgi:hypothetical protein
MSDHYKEFFVNRKPSSFGIPLVSQWHKRMLVIASKYIPNLYNKTILEIGAGHGFFAEQCKHNHITYYGHEMNTHQATHLQQAGYAITQATIPPIPTGHPVQVIWLSHVLEHAATFLEARGMLEACYNRLEPTGYIVIIAPDLFSWKSFFWSVDWSHGFPTTLARVEQLLNEVGFTIHRSMHHTCTMTNSCLAYLLSFLFSLFPTKILDHISATLIGKRLASNFMAVFGLRQIFIIGKK